MIDKKISAWAEEFILYKQSIGYVYNTQQFYLNNYIRYTEENLMDLIYPTKQSVKSYLNTMASSSGSLYNTTAVLREFGRYMQKHGFKDAYIIPQKSAVQAKAAPPYFFTHEEIETFFKALDKIESFTCFRGRELVFPALFRLLYCCGLRCKEARTLLCHNVNLSECYLDIIQSKGPKSRRLFISQELAKYLIEYDTKINIVFPKREYFFPHGDGCYASAAISNNFKRFWKNAYPNFIITTRPRAYDFRHHFACENLNRWAAEGLDINVMIVYLMSYMGHQSIRSTLYYFHFVPEFFPTFNEKSKFLETIIPEVPCEEKQS